MVWPENEGSTQINLSIVYCTGYTIPLYSCVVIFIFICLIADCRNLLRRTLNSSPDERYTCSEILVHPWTKLMSRSPALLQTQPKYTLETCLPIIVYQQPPMPIPSPQNLDIIPSNHTPRPAPQGRSYAGPSNARTIRQDMHPISQTVEQSTTASTTPRTAKQHKQIVARIGAAGRRFADAMKHVGQKDSIKK